MKTEREESLEKNSQDIRVTNKNTVAKNGWSMRQTIFRNRILCEDWSLTLDLFLNSTYHIVRLCGKYFVRPREDFSFEQNPHTMMGYIS